MDHAGAPWDAGLRPVGRDVRRGVRGIADAKTMSNGQSQHVKGTVMPIVNDPHRRMTVDTNTGYFVRFKGLYDKGFLAGFDFGRVENSNEHRIAGMTCARASSPLHGTTDPLTGKEVLSEIYQLRLINVLDGPLGEASIARLARPLIEKAHTGHGATGPNGPVFDDVAVVVNKVEVDLSVPQYSPFRGRAGA